MSETTKGHERVSIPYPEEHDALVGFGAFRILESFGAAADREVYDYTRRAMGVALKRFPELTGETVTVAQRQDWDDYLGRADMLNRIVYLPVEHATTLVTLYHELAHLAIQVLDERGADVSPSSERYTGLFGVARMPPEHVDEQRIPYFDVEYAVPKERLPRVAAHALAYRQEKHDYHQQAIRWLTGEESLPSAEPEYPEVIR